MLRYWQWGLQGGLGEERPGLPWAGHSWLQQPQGTAEPLSQDGGTSGKPYLRKGKTKPKTHQKQRRGEKKEHEKQLYKHHGQERRRCRCSTALEQIPTLQPVEEPTPQQVDIPKGAVAHTEPTSEQRKCMMKKKQQRRITVYCL